MSATRTRRAKRREPRRPGDTDRAKRKDREVIDWIRATPPVATLGALPAMKLAALKATMHGRAVELANTSRIHLMRHVGINRYEPVVDARQPREHPTKRGRFGKPKPTGGDYRTAAIQPDTSPLPRVTWTVPADACRVLGAFSVGLWLLNEDEARLVDDMSGIQDAELDGRGAMRDGQPVWRIGTGRRVRMSARALHLAPLPDWLAAQLWQRCPRDDGRMWRWTDVLSEDDAARLEGAVRCDKCGPSVGTERGREWCRSCGGDGLGAERDEGGFLNCVPCGGFGTLSCECVHGWRWPANGRGIPVGSRLVRLAPGSAGRMLALAMAKCEACDEGETEETYTCGSCDGDGVVDGIDGEERTCGECDGYGHTGIIACTGTGTVPLATIRDASDARERGE